MSAEPVRRWEPFAAAVAALVVITVAVFRLPESFVAMLERNALLQGSAAGWAYRLLAVAAVGQAAYVGFVVLRPERVAVALARQPSPPAHILVAKSLAYNAAGMAALTLVYGIAAFAVTGLRAGFWLFVVIESAQLGWYYRLTGTVVEWLRFQPEPDTPSSGDGAPRPYCPPLARGLLGASTRPGA